MNPSDGSGTSTASLHPLLAQLFVKHGFTELTAESIDAFVAAPGHSLLMFMEDPLRVKETLDLAVIVPELAKAFAHRFRVGVLLPETARQVQARYGFRRWPAFVVLKDGAYVGVVEGLRNWDEYIETVQQLLDAPAVRPPTIGIAVTTASGERQCSS